MYLGTLVIPASADVSNEISFVDFNGYTIHAPAVLPEVVEVQLSAKGGDFSEHQTAGADVALTAGKATTIIDGEGESIRLKAPAGNPAASRTFHLYAKRGNRSRV